MKAALFIAGCLLVMQLKVSAQTRIPVKVFHCDLQICHVIAFTQEDYVVILYNDRTIEVVKYSNHNNSSVVKNTYSGRYIWKNDSILAESLVCRTETKNQFPEATGKHVQSAKKLSFTVSTIFTIKEGAITVKDGLFPRMHETTIAEAMLLENKFQGWKYHFSGKVQATNRYRPVYR